MNIQLTLAARYLFGRPLRTTLTTLAVVFGVLVLFAMNTVLPSFIAAFQANVLAAFGQVDLTITHKTSEAFSPAVLDRVRTVDGVRVADGFLSRTLNLPADFVDHDPAQPDRVIALSVVGLEVETAQQIRSYVIEAGRFLTPEDTDAAVIAATLAEALGVKLGDTITLPTTEGTTRLTIVGLRPARTIAGNEEVLVTLGEAQRLFNQPGLINTIDVAFTTIDEPKRSEITQAIQAALGENYRVGALSTGTEFFATLQLGQYIMNLFGVVALVMGGFIIFNTFRTIVVERRRDIAMLRAVGASRNTVIGVILAEGFLQGAIGTAAGMILGYLLGAAIVNLASTVGRQFVNVQIGSPVVSPVLVGVTVVLGIGVTVVSGLLPALSASHVSPLEALRPAAVDVQTRIARRSAFAGAAFLVLAVLGLISGNVAFTGLGALLCLLGLALIAPALVRPIASVFGALIAVTFARNGVGSLAEGNLIRQPSRTAITASTTMIGLAVIVAMAALVTSVTGTFLSILKKSLGSDYLFVPPSIALWSSNVGAAGQGSLADELRAVEGVGVVSTLRFAASAAPSATSASLKSTSAETAVSLLGLDPATFTQVSGLNFEAGDPAIAWDQLARGRNIIVNGPMASALQLTVGDTVKLITPDGAQDYHVIAVANDYINAKITTGYISQANMAADFHKTEDVFLQLNLAPGAQASVVEPKLEAVVDRYPQFNMISGQAYYEQNQSLFYASFGALYVLFGLLALPSLIATLNTLAIGVIERTREIGMLRAVGATRKQVRGMVLAEAILLAAIGTAFGLLGGLYLGYLIVSALKFGGFTVAYEFPLYGVFSAVAIGLLFGVIAALIPARQAAKLEIVQALRYE
jgi:putative ABC transport system permease protein